MNFACLRITCLALVFGSLFPEQVCAGEGHHSRGIKNTSNDVGSSIASSELGAKPACAAQRGRVLYENNFDRNRRGQTSPRGLLVQATGAEPDNTQVGHFFNRADYCLDVIFPPNDPSDAAYSIGVRFISADAHHFYLADLTNSGIVSLYKGFSSNWPAP